MKRRLNIKTASFEKPFWKIEQWLNNGLAIYEGLTLNILIFFLLLPENQYLLIPLINQAQLTNTKRVNETLTFTPYCKPIKYLIRGRGTFT